MTKNNETTNVSNDKATTNVSNDETTTNVSNDEATNAFVDEQICFANNEMTKNETINAFDNQVVEIKIDASAFKFFFNVSSNFEDISTFDENVTNSQEIQIIDFENKTTFIDSKNMKSFILTK